MAISPTLCRTDVVGDKVGVLRALGRLLRTLVHVVRGLVLLRWKFPQVTGAQREAMVMLWSAQLLERLGVRLEVQGQVHASGPLLLVANHISWVDIAVIHATCFCRFVSKADVHHWPVIGFLATQVGTLFIERQSRRDAMRVVHQMAASLQAGDVLAIFPEGTTSDGAGLLPFHGNLLQAAIAADTPVQPVAISFVDGVTGRISTAAAYVGDDVLLGAIWRTLRARDLTVRVRLGPLQRNAGQDRRAWAAQLREQIAQLRVAEGGR